MTKETAAAAEKNDVAPQRRVRADAQRSLDALLDAARQVFGTSGVDAPVREIAERAGVGVGTVYRHFPERSDLIKAVFRRGIDGCVAAAAPLSATHPPFEALKLWIERYLEFVATKRGLSGALHSGNPAYGSLQGYFEQHLLPTLRGLLDRAAEAGEVRRDVDPRELLIAISSLSSRADDTADAERARRMVFLLLDGLRFSEPASA